MLSRLTDSYVQQGFQIGGSTPRSIVGSLAGVHSDVVSETAAAAVFDIGLQSSSWQLKQRRLTQGRPE